jgi:hypothetical protein
LEAAKQLATLAMTFIPSLLQAEKLSELEISAVELSIEDVMRELSLHPEKDISHDDKWQDSYWQDVRPHLPENSKYRKWGDGLIVLFAAGYEQNGRYDIASKMYNALGQSIESERAAKKASERQSLGGQEKDNYVQAHSDEAEYHRKAQELVGSIKNYPMLSERERTSKIDELIQKIREQIEKLQDFPRL